MSNYNIITEAAKPFYDVKTLLLQSAERNEQFHVAYPILHSAATVESLGRFLEQAPQYYHTLHQEDQVEVKRRMEVLKEVSDSLRTQVTDLAVEDLFSPSRSA